MEHFVDPRLEKSIVAFSELTSIPVTFYSHSGAVMWTHNQNRKLCLCNPAYGDSDSRCRKVLRNAMKTAHGLSEVYIFTCASGLVNLAYTLTNRNLVIGHYIAGPFVMGASREKAMGHLYRKIPFYDMDIPRVMSITDSMRIYTPAEANHLMTLFADIFNAQVAEEFLEEINQETSISQNESEFDVSTVYSGASGTVREALSYIHENSSLGITLTRVSEAAHVNSSYLSTLFKKEMGINLSGYVQNLRLENARDMLDKTDMSITEIAISCGFDSASYFTKLFREKYNKTPRQYRGDNQ